MSLRRKIFFYCLLIILTLGLTLVWHFRYEFFYSYESRVKIAQTSYDEAIKILDSDTKKSLRNFRFAHRLNPDNYNYQWQVALTEKRLGKLEESIKSFESLATRVTDQPLLYIHQGETYEDAGMESHAVEAYGKAINLQKQSPTAYIRLANLLIKQNKKDEAIKILEDGRQKIPQSSEILQALQILGK